MQLTTKRLLERDLIPALENIDCWRLASNVRQMITLMDESDELIESVVPSEHSNSCALRPASFDSRAGLQQRLREHLDQTEGWSISVFSIGLPPCPLIP